MKEKNKEYKTGYEKMQAFQEALGIKDDDDTVIMVVDPCAFDILSDLEKDAQSYDEIVEVIDTVIEAFMQDYEGDI